MSAYSLEINLIWFVLYYLKQKSEVPISRIRDEDIEDEDELFQFSNGHGETSNGNPKVPKCQVVIV